MQTSKCLIGKITCIIYKTQIAVICILRKKYMENLFYYKTHVLAIVGDTSTNFLTMFELERTAVEDKSSRVPLAA